MNIVAHQNSLSLLSAVFIGVKETKIRVSVININGQILSKYDISICQFHLLGTKMGSEGVCFVKITI